MPAAHDPRPHGLARRVEGRDADVSAHDLFIRFHRTRDRRLRNALVELHRPIAVRHARRYEHRGEFFDDLLQVAEVGLIKAVERFDPHRDIDFAVFAGPTITGEIKHHFRDVTWAVSVPRRAKELRTSVAAASETLSQQLGRSATAEEIAAVIEVDADEVAETIVANQAYRSDSIERDVRDDERVDGSARREFDEDPCATVAARHLETVRALEELGERQRKIVVWRFFEECTQREIGDRLGVGQVQVSRLLRAALDQLRRDAARRIDAEGSAQVDVSVASRRGPRASERRAS